MIESLIKKLPNNKPAIIHSDFIVFGKKILLYKDKIKYLFEKHFENGLFLPSYTFGKKKIINFDKEQLSIGGLSNLFIKDKKISRIINPIHSYMYLNIKIKNNKSFTNRSFGIGSIFDYFVQNNMNWVNFGPSNNNSWTIFHHIETLCNVFYRKKIKINKMIIHKNKKKKIFYNYFARKYPNIKLNFDLAVKEMIKDKVLTRINFYDKNIIYGNCKQIANYSILKIKKNEKYFIK